MIVAIQPRTQGPKVVPNPTTRSVNLQASSALAVHLATVQSLVTGTLTRATGSSSIKAPGHPRGGLVDRQSIHLRAAHGQQQHCLFGEDHRQRSLGQPVHPGSQPAADQQRRHVPADMDAQRTAHRPWW